MKVPQKTLVGVVLLSILGGCIGAGVVLYFRAGAAQSIEYFGSVARSLTPDKGGDVPYWIRVGVVLSDWVIAAFTVALFVAAHVANRNGRRALRQSRAANRTAIGAAEAANKSAAVAKDTVDAMVAAERAYLVFCGDFETSTRPIFESQPRPEGWWEIGFSIRNVGRSPAVLTNVAHRIVCAPHGNPGRDGPLVGFETFQVVESMHAAPQLFTGGVSDSDWKMFQRGEAAIFAAIRFEYRDVFGPHAPLAVSLKYDLDHRRFWIDRSSPFNSGPLGKF